mgnify:CR=1 FL=1
MRGLLYMMFLAVPISQPHRHKHCYRTRDFTSLEERMDQRENSSPGHRGDSNYSHIYFSPGDRQKRRGGNHVRRNTDESIRY